MNNTIETVVKYGNVVSVDDKHISISGHNFDEPTFYRRLIAGEFDDFKDFYEGEEVVVLIYYYPIIDGDTSLIGIVDKKQYDGAIRDSQKLPKGWKHEPYIGFITIQGKLELTGEDYFTEAYIWIDGKVEYGFEDFENFDAEDGDDVVVTGFGITYPNDKKVLYASPINIYKKDEYYNKYEKAVKEYYYKKYSSDKNKAK